MKLVRLSVFCALAALTTLPQVAHADLLFSTYTGESVTSNNANQVLGTEFLVGASNLLVTDLGVYDANLDGLVFSHQVGIWRVSDQALVGSATVPSGTAGTLTEKWRFTTASFTLSANTTYRIGALESTPADGNPFSGTFSLSGGVASVTSGSVFSGSGFVFPSNSNGVARVFANAIVTVAGGGSAPEPGTLALLALGGACAFARRRRCIAR
ncbi:PEP-CTERM sorting domain-containing protein [Armatimonas sp.]|uniref:PEP-CTERM sorting domain-containing protein n=1 Tax=Armatimonas sp. TaxID=1872638 RepID=UPI00374CB554